MAGIGDNGGPPLVPPERPSDGKLRAAIIRAAIKWLIRAGLTAADITAPEVLIPLEIGIEVGSWAYPYIRAYFDGPKSLRELQAAANDPEPGYDIHHIVEQTPAEQDGFSSDRIDAPDNLVHIPTVKHWELNRWYETANDEFGGLTPRQYARGKDWAERQKVGRMGLIVVGVLTP